MIAFDTIVPAIQTAITGEGLGDVTPSTGAAAPTAKWSKRPRGFANPDAKRKLEIRITSIHTLGRDETRQVHAAGPPETVSFEQCGQRAILVETKVESERSGDLTWCWKYVEDIRAGLHKLETRETLRAAGVGIAEVGNASSIELRRDGRHISAAVFTTTFLCALSHTPEASEEWIETIELSSTITKAEGFGISGDLSDESLP